MHLHAVLRDLLKVRHEIPYLPLWFFFKLFGGTLRRIFACTNDARKNVVLLLPGFCEGTNEFVLLMRAIERCGYAVETLGAEGVHRWLRVILSLREMIEEGTKRLRALRRKRCRVILVGHSKGAIAAHALAYRFPKTVSAIVLIAGPIQGSRLASVVAQLPIAHFLDSVRDLAPESAFLERIRRRRPQCPIVVLASQNDGLAPFTHCHVEGMQLHVVSAAHLGFFLSPRGIEAVADCFRQDLT